ncbi:MAG: hypothetical protein KIS92_16270 [Planctomycetota bacterium]|nr:hypothetical protein [Planctomycetota bacterium]
MASKKKIPFDRALEESGWLEAYTPENRTAFMAAVKKNMAESTGEFVQIPGTWFDVECVYDTGCHKELIEDLARDSFGLFQPEKVEETWDEEADPNRIKVSITCGGKTYSGAWDYEDDYLDMSFFALLHKTIRGMSKKKLDLFELSGGGGQDGVMVVAPKAAVEKLRKQGYLPKEDSEEDDGEE